MLYFLSFNDAPQEFPIDTVVVIEEGASTQAILEELEKHNVIQSSAYLSLLLKLDYRDAYIRAGSYLFPRSLTGAEVAEAITKGFYTTPPIKIRIPEGFRAAELLSYLPEQYAGADVSLAIEKEGYLFPDTYYIEKSTTFEEILAMMEDNFRRKTRDIDTTIMGMNLTLDDIIVLASILEREGNNEESMRTIAGILLERLHIGMPLQVDATFYYLIGKPSSELTRADLDMDSPFNTYKNKGLPPAPIANPGLTAIRAVLDPIPSKYLFYLTGNDGKFYYAETYDEHRENRWRYIE